MQKVNPSMSEIYAKLANCYSSTGQTDIAFENYEKSFDLEPNHKTLSNLIFCLNFKTDFSKKKNLELLNKFNFFVPRINNTEHSCNKKNLEKINIGFVSGDLRYGHPVGNCMYDFLKILKKSFNLYAYYNNEADEKTTKNFEVLFIKWNNIEKESDEEVIKKIKQNKIDLLIDLSGHTDKNRLSVFANKPAFLQIAWCGYLNSTGISEIDYIIGDPHSTPKNENIQFTEKILQMPNIWCCYSMPEYKKLNIVLETPAIKKGIVTFGAFHQIKKINKQVINLWSKIISSIDKSILIIRTPELDNKITREKILYEFENMGLNKKKIILEGSTSKENLLSEYNKIDIFLDTFPYNGGSTSFECAFMGVPMLTLKGDRFLSRCGLSINTNLGMHEWIANDQEEYYKKAVKFSKNIDNLNLIRKNLHSKAINSPLFDSKKFAKDFEIIIKNLLFTHLK
jgi:predicted O-linked N-acetylglucosamine transferase (SPINDLY family)